MGSSNKNFKYAAALGLAGEGKGGMPSELINEQSCVLKGLGCVDEAVSYGKKRN